MMSFFELAANNLFSPVVLCFALGLFAALIRSELTIPDAVSKAMSIYLLFAIGFKGGAAVARHGVGDDLILAIGLGVALSFALPFLAFALLRASTQLSNTDAAAVAAHYGSISIVTYVAGTEALKAAGIAHDGYMVAVAAAMEAPAIVAALWLMARGETVRAPGAAAYTASPTIPREVLTNGSVVVLLGAALIGYLSGEKGYGAVSSFITAPFQGVLCLFLLDMGLVAGRRLIASGGALRAPVLAAALYLPLIGAVIGGVSAALLGFGVGETALFIILAASASYIAVPSAMRIAAPEANPAISLTLSLGLTFPFNLILGLPLYIALAEALVGGS